MKRGGATAPIPSLLYRLIHTILFYICCNIAQQYLKRMTYSHKTDDDSVSERWLTAWCNCFPPHILVVLLQNESPV